MKIAVRNNDVYTNYYDRFNDDEIVAEPYNYKIVEITDIIDLNRIEFSDFDFINNEFIFNYKRFSERTAIEEEKAKNAKYKHQIDELIREKYSINDEIAIIRQRYTKPDEFVDYFEYIESVKKEIKSSFE